MMVEQEIPAGSGKIYGFISANRNDLLTMTGNPRYLPVKMCKSYGINCEPIMKHKDVGSTEKNQVRCHLPKCVHQYWRHTLPCKFERHQYFQIYGKKEKKWIHKWINKS